jgi:hypothetical protein
MRPAEGHGTWQMAPSTHPPDQLQENVRSAEIHSVSCEPSQPLRWWAQGEYRLEAAIELLLRAARGSLADSGWPWVVTEGPTKPLVG